VPAGTIEDQDGMGTLGDMPADLGQAQAHGLGVGVRQNEPCPIARSGHTAPNR
jgi:hypothetical protein